MPPPCSALLAYEWEPAAPGLAVGPIAVAVELVALIAKRNVIRACVVFYQNCLTKFRFSDSGLHLAAA